MKKHTLCQRPGESLINKWLVQLCKSKLQLEEIFMSHGTKSKSQLWNSIESLIKLKSLMLEQWPMLLTMKEEKREWLPLETKDGIKTTLTSLVG